MQGYQHKHGDRPLEGYTIQRAVGRGGFGEVYYAFSDSGREVALKCVQGYEDIELRGIRQCMNLKNPHLVTIFDVKYNDQNRPFVIMEYVSGPSLRDLLSECPSGLGAQKAAFFLREIAKGLTYLHDRGIVHRDLKPGNVFYEDGYVKIGDYGLSKAMTASQHSGQTITVGTVHYMAPEIGQGRYDQGIDIYALGVVLYEMLTGQVPFIGSSPGEVLMKHMAAEPDLSGIEEPFATVIRRAMAKDPTERYHTVQEMVEAVFGAEHIRDSVSNFRPESLSVVADRVAQKVGVAAGGGSSAEPTITLGPDVPHGQGGSSAAWKKEDEDWWGDFGRRMESWSERFGRWGERFGRDVAQHVKEGGLKWHDIEREVAADPKLDPLGRKQRRVLTIISAVVVAAGTAMVAPRHLDDPTVIYMLTLFAIAGATVGIWATRYKLKLESESHVLRRLAYGGFGTLGLVACTIALAMMYSPRSPYIDGSFLSLVVCLFLLNWEYRTWPGRDDRVSLGLAIWAGIVGAIAALVLDGAVELVAGILAGTSLTVQVLSPYDPKGPKHWKHTLKSIKKQIQESWNQTGPDRDKAGSPATPPPVPPAPGRAGAQPATPQGHTAPPPPAGSVTPMGRHVPARVRELALLAFVLLLGLGVMMLIWAGMVTRQDEFVAGVCVGIGGLLFSLLALAKAIQIRFVSWWSSLVKPAVMLACIVSAVSAAVYMGTFTLRDDEMLVALGFVIFPAIIFFVAAALPNAAMHSIFGEPLVCSTRPQTVSTRRRLWALLLAFVWFFGAAGLQRIYVGKVWTGLLWLLTWGLAGIGQIYDIVKIARGRFTDRHGLPLIIWHDMDELNQPYGSVAGGRFAAPANGAAVGRSPSGRVLGPRFQVINPALTLIGGLLLLVAVVIGLMVAIDLPRIVAAGFPDASLARELDEIFGYRGWPQLVSKVGTALTFITVFLAACSLCIARRKAGGVHIARAVLGSFGLLFALIPTLHQALQYIRWETVVPMITGGGPMGPGIEMILNSVESVPACAAGIIVLVSIAVLVWPAPWPAIGAPGQRPSETEDA